MTTETKNKDYSKSAENLCNPAIIGEMLEQLDTTMCIKKSLNERIQELIPAEIKEDLERAEQEIQMITNEIELLIDTQGSYQDLERGFYAIKQRRESITYNVQKTRNSLEDKLAEMVVEETVNKGKMEGLIKGGFITAEQARGCADIKETFSTIIKAGE